MKSWPFLPGLIARRVYEVGLLRTGDDLRLTLRRVAGKYSLVVEDQTTHSSSTLAIAHPSFLDGARDLHVGLFKPRDVSGARGSRRPRGPRCRR